MSKIIPIGILKEDVAIYQKMTSDLTYLEELRKIWELTTTLGIETMTLYYHYQKVLKQLENYSYYEASINKRLEDKQYFDRVKELSELTKENLPRKQDTKKL